MSSLWLQGLPPEREATPPHPGKDVPRDIERPPYTTRLPALAQTLRPLPELALSARLCDDKDLETAHRHGCHLTVGHRSQPLSAKADKPPRSPKKSPASFHGRPMAAGSPLELDPLDLAGCKFSPTFAKPLSPPLCGSPVFRPRASPARAGRLTPRGPLPASPDHPPGAAAGGLLGAPGSADLVWTPGSSVGSLSRSPSMFEEGPLDLDVVVLSHPRGRRSHQDPALLELGASRKANKAFPILKPLDLPPHVPYVGPMISRRPPSGQTRFSSWCPTPEAPREDPREGGSGEPVIRADIRMRNLNSLSLAKADTLIVEDST